MIWPRVLELHSLVPPFFIHLRWFLCTPQKNFNSHVQISHRGPQHPSDRCGCCCAQGKPPEDNSVHQLSEDPHNDPV